MSHQNGVEECIDDGKLVLANGRRVEFVASACVKPMSSLGSRVLVVKGEVGGKVADTLRDTGCSSVVVREGLVDREQYTGEHRDMMMIDSSVKRVPVARIFVDCPYLCGEVEALSLPNPMCDLIVGNVDGAREVDDPYETWQLAGAGITRLQSTRKDANRGRVETAATGVKGRGNGKQGRHVHVRNGEAARDR